MKTHHQTEQHAAEKSQVIQIELPIAALKTLTDDKQLSIDKLHCLNGASKTMIKRMLLEKLRQSLATKTGQHKQLYKADKITPGPVTAATTPGQAFIQQPA